MRLIHIALLLVVTACARPPHHDSQTKLLVRWIFDVSPDPNSTWSDGPTAGLQSLRTKITSDDFARSTLSVHPQLAAAISKSEIQLKPNSWVVVISVSAATPDASLEGVRVLVEAVTLAAHKIGPLNVSMIEKPALPK